MHAIEEYCPQPQAPPYSILCWGIANTFFFRGELQVPFGAEPETCRLPNLVTPTDKCGKILQFFFLSIVKPGIGWYVAEYFIEDKPSADKVLESNMGFLLIVFFRMNINYVRVRNRPVPEFIGTDDFTLIA